MMLRVQLQPKFLNEVKLHFERVDMSFLIMHEPFKQIAGHVVPHRVAMGRSFFRYSMTCASPRMLHLQRLRYFARGEPRRRVSGGRLKTAAESSAQRPEHHP